MKTSEEQFRTFMAEVAKCEVGSSEPYAAGLERDYRRVWQASREALVIELPKAMEGPDVDDDYEQFEIHENTAIEVNGMRRQCMKAIEAAGLKVKS